MPVTKYVSDQQAKGIKKIQIDRNKRFIMYLINVLDNRTILIDNALFSIKKSRTLICPALVNREV